MKEFNTVGFTVFDIPGYFFFAVIGLVVSTSMFIILVEKKKYSLPKNIRNLFISAIIVILVARLFGCLSGVYRDLGLGNDITWNGVKNTGIVFYGGLIGLLISYSTMAKYSKQDIYIMDLLAVCIPLFHSISRVGCFVGGCCYGKESLTRLSINYTTTVLGEVTTAPRIPIQLVESVFNICLFLYLYRLSCSENWKENKILRRYLLIYSIGRFFIEFFRGDLVRGILYGISFSQAISVLIWIYLFVVVLKERSKRLIKEEILL